MIAVDTNILVYAHRQDSSWHQAATRCLRQLAESTRPWAIAWSSIHEFISVATHPRIYDPPSTLTEACEQVEVWLESPTLNVLGEGPGYWSVLRPLLETGRVVGPRVHDGRIASICLQHGVVELWSADRDFSRFPRLTVKNPLLEVAS
ncbi:MAG: TA system VapC family ribonuclease toxin [Thermoanaerobaculia bacterium]